MRSFNNLLALPASLLAIALTDATNAIERQWPYNLPRDVKYFPEDEAHVKRELEAQEKLAWQSPIGVKKLSEDPSEKFFLHYWNFEENPGWGEELGHYNETHIKQASSPLLPLEDLERPGYGLFGRNIFGRQSSCPNGTFSCDATGTTYCCTNGDTCVTSSSGAPGCCPPGQTCGGVVAGCGAGYEACGNGCCTAGASCASTICINFGTQTVTTTLPTATVTNGVSTISKSSASSSATTSPPPVVAQPSAYTTTATVTISGSNSVQTTTIVQPTTVLVTPSQSSSTQPATTPTSSSASTCSTGFFSCPSSLGGGCCRNGQDCNTGTHCPDLPTSTPTSTGTASAPILPTSVSTSTISDTPISGAGTTNSVCPTGYYMCSAVYLGGCCRVDRDCKTTYCPETDSTNVVTSSGLTIAAGGTAVGTVTSTTTASEVTITSGTSNVAAAGSGCAANHFLCPASLGGGCCPSGFACASNCVASVSGVASQPKEAPSTAVVAVLSRAFFALAVGAAIGMLWL